MKKKLRNNLYTTQKLSRVNGQLKYITNEDGTLFSGPYKTKIMPEDLPEWYIYGRYYKRFGYLSTKGITDMLYLPNMHFNHFLKDDCLLIAYGGEIKEIPGESLALIGRYAGYDEYVCGTEIIEILKGARKYSGYDISSFIEKIKEKKSWLIEKFPEEFGPDRWECDVDKLFED